MEVLSNIGPVDWAVPQQRGSIHMLFFLQVTQQIWMCMTGGSQAADMPLMFSSSCAGHQSSLLTQEMLVILNAGVHKVIPVVLVNGCISIVHQLSIQKHGLLGLPKSSVANAGSKVASRYNALSSCEGHGSCTEGVIDN